MKNSDMGDIHIAPAGISFAPLEANGKRTQETTSVMFKDDFWLPILLGPKGYLAPSPRCFGDIGSNPDHYVYYMLNCFLIILGETRFGCRSCKFTDEQQYSSWVNSMASLWLVNYHPELAKGLSPAKNFAGKLYTRVYDGTQPCSIVPIKQMQDVIKRYEAMRTQIAQKLEKSAGDNSETTEAVPMEVTTPGPIQDLNAFLNDVQDRDIVKKWSMYLIPIVGELEGHAGYVLRATCGDPCGSLDYFMRVIRESVSYEIPPRYSKSKHCASVHSKLWPMTADDELKEHLKFSFRWSTTRGDPNSPLGKRSESILQSVRLKLAGAAGITLSGERNPEAARINDKLCAEQPCLAETIKAKFKDLLPYEALYSQIGDVIPTFNPYQKSNMYQDTHITKNPWSIHYELIREYVTRTPFRYGFLDAKLPDGSPAWCDVWQSPECIRILAAHAEDQGGSLSRFSSRFASAPPEGPAVNRLKNELIKRTVTDGKRYGTMYNIGMLKSLTHRRESIMGAKHYFASAAIRTAIFRKHARDLRSIADFANYSNLLGALQEECVRRHASYFPEPRTHDQIKKLPICGTFKEALEFMLIHKEVKLEGPSVHSLLHGFLELSSVHPVCQLFLLLCHYCSALPWHDDSAPHVALVGGRGAGKSRLHNFLRTECFGTREIDKSTQTSLVYGEDHTHETFLFDEAPQNFVRPEEKTKSPSYFKTMFTYGKIDAEVTRINPVTKNLEAKKFKRYVEATFIVCTNQSVARDSVISTRFFEWVVPSVKKSKVYLNAREEICIKTPDQFKHIHCYLAWIGSAIQEFALQPPDVSIGMEMWNALVETLKSTGIPCAVNVWEPRTANRVRQLMRTACIVQAVYDWQKEGKTLSDLRRKQAAFQQFLFCRPATAIWVLSSLIGVCIDIEAALLFRALYAEMGVHWDNRHIPLQDKFHTKGSKSQRGHRIDPNVAVSCQWTDKLTESLESPTGDAYRLGHTIKAAMLKWDQRRLKMKWNPHFMRTLTHDQSIDQRAWAPAEKDESEQYYRVIRRYKKNTRLEVLVHPWLGNFDIFYDLIRVAALKTGLIPPGSYPIARFDPKKPQECLGRLDWDPDHHRELLVKSFGTRITTRYEVEKPIPSALKRNKRMRRAEGPPSERQLFDRYMTECGVLGESAWEAYLERSRNKTGLC